MTHTIPKTRTALQEAAFQRVKPVIDALHEVIASTGDRGLPSGHLYAMLMDKMDLETYQNMIDLMIDAGGITLSNHVLRVVK